MPTFMPKFLLRRLILFGAPLFAGLVLLFHPTGDPSGPKLDTFSTIAPVADRFIVVHILFAPAIGLLGLAIITLLDGQQSRAASISRFAAGVFVVFYIVYESVVGTATGAFIRAAKDFPAEQHAVAAQVIDQVGTDRFLGDFPAIIPDIAMAAWVVAIVFASLALRQADYPLVGCILLTLSFVMTVHSPPSGPIGMLFFLLAMAWFEWAALRSGKRTAVFAI